MFHKTYTANAVRDGKIAGCITVKVPFWYTAYDAWDFIDKAANSQNARPSDFRRVK